MKRMTPLQLTMAAFCIAVNITGAYIALCLRLPVYMDSIGTILAGALFGPWYGAAVGMGSGLISGASSDIYAFYFIPVGIMTGMMSGFLFKTCLMRGKWMPAGTALMTAPGTLAGAIISAFLFGGVTSSGSSVLVQIMKHMGVDLVAAAFAVQVLTDYADRFISLALVLAVMSYMGNTMKTGLKGGRYGGTV